MIVSPGSCFRVPSFSCSILWSHSCMQRSSRIYINRFFFFAQPVGWTEIKPDRSPHPHKWCGSRDISSNAIVLNVVHHSQAPCLTPSIPECFQKLCQKSRSPWGICFPKKGHFRDFWTTLALLFLTESKVKSFFCNIFVQLFFLFIVKKQQLLNSTK